MSALENWGLDDPDLRADLRHPRRWLVTGAAGFIGSNLVQALLEAGQVVVGLDNFSTGHRRNLNEVALLVGPSNWARFTLVEGDIRDLPTCNAACLKIDHVLHQAALGSVPRSIEDPVATNSANVTGFLNMLDAARRTGVSSMVYAASSSTYGDEPTLPKREDRIGQPLSPYAVTKLVNEIYASVYRRTYGFSAVGLRYFNVFGPRQDPDGAYAAVIPKWTGSMINDEPLFINGDGETSRDFCFVANAVQANIRAALAKNLQDSVFNVAVGNQTTLNMLFAAISDALSKRQIHYAKTPVYREFRSGDVRHSLADIDRAQRLIGYQPTHDIGAGIEKAMDWYVDFFAHKRIESNR